ncbi:hypothetical protein SHIRM173S_12581 [Streptomyces hirsutus]
MLRRSGERAELGPRARKTERTRDAIGDAAVSLSWSAASTASNDIAAVAEISKPTLFRYFPTKEDLVLHRFADHQGGGRHASYVTGVLHQTGDGAAPALPGRPRSVRPRHRSQRSSRGGGVHRLVFTTPSLAGRLTRYQSEDEEALADALGDGIQARLLAAQYSRSNGCSPGNATGRRSPTVEPPTTSTPRPWPKPTRHSTNYGDGRRSRSKNAPRSGARVAMGPVRPLPQGMLAATASSDTGRRHGPDPVVTEGDGGEAG